MRWKQSVAVATLGLGLVAAACGGDNSGPSVASTTAGATTAGSTAGGGSKTTTDGLTYTFTLRDNLAFANGTPITSDTVKKTFEYNKGNAKAPAIIKATFDPVTSVTAPDPKTVVVKLTQPSRNFLFNIAQT